MRLVIAVMFISFSVACKAPPAVYQGQYPKEKFVAVVTDLYYAEAALKNLDEQKYDSLRTLYRAQVAEIHKVDLTVIENDLAALQQQPSLYNEMHSEVIDSLVLMEKNLSVSKEMKLGKSKPTN